MNRKPLLKHMHIIRLTRLLDMLYKPSELADEIGVNVDTIYRSYIPAGLPIVRDAKNNYWVHGPAFVAWARETISRKKARRRGLPDGHAWCMVCNSAVIMNKPRVKSVNRYIELLQAACPHCGKTVNRARARQMTPLPFREGAGG